MNSVDGHFLWVSVHTVQARAASMLHQSRNTGTVQSLFKLLDKLEECAENHKAITIKGVIYILLYLAEAQLS